MNVLEHMMQYYNEALEELMDAQKYADCAEKADSQKRQMMYHNLAKQELEHEAALVEAGNQLFTGVDASDSLHMVWHHLKKHLHDWRGDIEYRLSNR